MYVQLSQVSSFETFCAVNPDDLFLLPPNSTWNYRNWMNNLCSMNASNLLSEIFESQFMVKMGMAVSIFYGSVIECNINENYDFTRYKSDFL